MLCLMGKALTDHPNKLGAGNAGVAVCGSGPVARRVLGRRGAAVFGGVFGARRRVNASGQLGLVLDVDGGNLRFFGSLRGRVRMAKSEWTGHDAGFAWFSSAAVKPDRLHRLNLGRAIGLRGVSPPRRADSSPLPVVSGRCQFGEKCPDRVRAATIELCSAVADARTGRKILSATSGSGVRAAHCAGVNDRSARRPEIFGPKYRRIWGLGEELPGPSAKGVNEAARLGPGARSVNQRP